MSLSDDAVVRRQVVVDVPIERAFTSFVERFGDFKPPEHNLLGAEITESRFEPRVGGHIYDRAADGSECRWARVLQHLEVLGHRRSADRQVRGELTHGFGSLGEAQDDRSPRTVA